MIDPNARDRRSRKWKRWERGAPMELWQMDIVGGFALADGTSAKALTGIDDHSRMCVCARLMNRERTRAVCDGLRDALARFGAPEQILTDNGKVFTGRFHHPPVEMLFEAICRQHGIERLLTQPRSPTTRAKSSGSIAVCAPNSSATAPLSPISRSPSRRWMNGSSTTTPLDRTSR
jgi:transposase InsO family protein